MAHVKDGIVTRVETGRVEELQLRACLRGRAFHHKVYAADRLQFPLKRIISTAKWVMLSVSWVAVNAVLSQKGG